MKSPFPGMDPYLEAHWGDVHTRLIVYACDQLASQLPSDLRVRAEEHVTVQTDDDEHRVFQPDVQVVERPSRLPEQSLAASDVAVAEPLVVPLTNEPPTQRSIRIVDTRAGNRLVTAIEILSPSNKMRSGASAYRLKQRAMLEAGVNLVELDLLRDGEYVLAAPPNVLPRNYLDAYRVCVVRASQPQSAEVYAASLQQPLPAIRVPLRPGDTDAVLSLQSLIAKCYENGGYGDTDYLQEPWPPLKPQEIAWAHALLKEKKLR